MREPSPPYEHVSWRDERDDVPHDAADDITVLAETVMGHDDAPARARRVPYLVKIVQYPLWAISVRALFGAALLPVPVFLYGSSRYHYFGHSSAHPHINQDALLAGVVLAFEGALVGMVIGALWGTVVVRHARRTVRRQYEGST